MIEFIGLMVTAFACFPFVSLYSNTQRLAKISELLADCSSRIVHNVKRMAQQEIEMA